MVTIKRLHVQNFKALKDIEFDLSPFSCVIGENNSGKSTLMKALVLFLKQSKISETDCYNKNEPIIISAVIGVSQDDLLLVQEEQHRERISDIMSNGEIKLTVRFPLGDKPKMTCTKKIPADPKWDEKAISELLKGKKGAELKTDALSQYPEAASFINAIDAPTITKVKEALDTYVKTLPDEAWKEDDFCPLPTGLDASVKALLPDPIYIEAVKDISDDMKTTERSVFGKLLGMIFESISSTEDMEKFKQTLIDLNEKLNVSVKEDGTKEDRRFEQIKNLEIEIGRNLSEHFPEAKVSISIPPPDLTKVLQSATLRINEGVEGDIETKGDGLKRSVVFSLFKTYANLCRTKTENGNPIRSSGHLILFEEPELYLHPKAQQVLFESLADVSRNAQIVVCTHSPLFFSSSTTKSFAKLYKVSGENSSPPYAKIISVDFEQELSPKDAFQLLCYENNNVAFFADTVLLVEGDSDVAVTKHLSRLLNTAWDFEKGRICLVKVGGKGNFRKFREFFTHFNVRSVVLGDLDVVLHGFDKLNLPQDSSAHKIKDELIKLLDSLITDDNRLPNADETKSTWAEDGTNLIALVNKVREQKTLTDQDLCVLEKIDNKLGKNSARMSVLKSNNTKVLGKKRELLNVLRTYDVLLFEKGRLEDYYPASIIGPDKVAKAALFRETITSKELAMPLANNFDVGGKNMNEFEAVFTQIFDSSFSSTLTAQNDEKLNELQDAVA